MKGALARRARRRATSVLPTPVGPIIRMFLGVISLFRGSATWATAGVYGNITGGRRGAVVGAFAHGLLISFLPAILLPMMGDMGLGSTTFGDADFGVVGIVLGHIIAMFN